MSEWITDRLPTEEDADINGSVYNELGIYTHWGHITKGRAWMPIVPPDPYVKPKRWTVREFGNTGQWYVVDVRFPNEARGLAILTREAAERIAAIYEEVMP